MVNSWWLRNHVDDRDFPSKPVRITILLTFHPILHHKSLILSSEKGSKEKLHYQQHRSIHGSRS